MDDPAAVSYYNDNLQLACSLVAQGFAVTAHPAASGTGGRTRYCFFSFEDSADVRAAVLAFYRGESRLDPVLYDRAKRKVFEAIDRVTLPARGGAK